MASTFPPDNLTTQEEIDYLANIRTTARRIFVGKLFKDRRKHQIPLPDGMEGRRWDDVNKKLDRIADDTGWLNKLLAGIFKSTAGEVEKKYPSRKK